MKILTCKDLGGACNFEFKAETFDEMANMSMKHGMEMAQNNDASHLKAMDEMKKFMSDPNAMEKWMNEKKKLFDDAPNI